MTHEVVRPAPAASATPRTRLAATPERTAVSALVRDLEDFRNSVLSGLGAIEELARHRSGSPPAEISRLEQSLQQKIEELDRERSQLRAGAEQEQASGRQLLVQLENDRRMLADAWEKLELERIETCSSRPAPSLNHPRSRGELAQQAPRMRLGSPSSESGNPVTETILRQFQTLCNDVRRTTNARFSSR
jgi:hypothetical protein